MREQHSILKNIISHFLKIEASIFLSKITFYTVKLNNKILKLKLLITLPKVEQIKNKKQLLNNYSWVCVFF